MSVAAEGSAVSSITSGEACLISLRKGGDVNSKYEYKFVIVEERELYQEVVHQYANQGWRLVQVLQRLWTPTRGEVQVLPLVLILEKPV